MAVNANTVDRIATLENPLELTPISDPKSELLNFLVYLLSFFKLWLASLILPLSLT